MLLTTACKRHEPPSPEPAKASTVPAAVPARIPPAPAPALSAALAASADLGIADPNCLERHFLAARSNGYEGAVSGASVYARLDARGGDVEGRYFYKKQGLDIALSGELLPDDGIRLEERTGDRVTGRFDGTCDRKGHIHGYWSKPDGTGAPPAFTLTSVARRHPLIIATKKRTRSFPPGAGKPTSQNPFEPSARCTESLAWPEVFGAGDAEDSINAALRKDGWIFDGDAEKSLKACTVGERVNADRTFSVEVNDGSLLVVSFRGSEEAEGGTHPYDPLGPEVLSFDVNTGSAIDRDDLLSVEGEAPKRLAELLRRCLRETFDASASDLDEWVLPRFVGDDATTMVYPTLEGLRFVATGYPPPMRVWEGDGVTIWYTALAAAGALPSDSPVAHLWKGIRPNPAVNPCVARRK